MIISFLNQKIGQMPLKKGKNKESKLSFTGLKNDRIFVSSKRKSSSGRKKEQVALIQELTFHEIIKDRE